MHDPSTSISHTSHRVPSRHLQLGLRLSISSQGSIELPNKHSSRLSPGLKISDIQFMESLNNSHMAPTDLQFSLLHKVTNGFSEEHKVGRGGYGEVYKGVLDNGEQIAVKKLHHIPGLDDVQFKNEFNNLMKVRHPNIIRLVGYCYEIRHIHHELKGDYVFSRVEERALCFEYLQGGSLDKHLSDEFCGLDWHTRYKIIKGICEGVNYLHKGSDDPIYHLDLKPANILLDENMIPKIGDFGLSRLFASTQTHITKQLIGTLDYMLPEYITKRQISEKYDVFSLGVIIIQIMTGPLGYSKYADMTSQEFIQHVHKNWRKRIESTPMYEEVDCQRVKRCIKIAINCLVADKSKRPTIGDIIHELEHIETMIHRSVEAGEGEQDKSPEPIVAKLGPWGGNGGTVHDIKVAPHRLKSVTIYSGNVVDALGFSYSDHSGHQHSVGQWGCPCPGPCGYTIKLQPSEFLLEISGTIGPFANSYSNVITSLTMVTNEDRYGPFGCGGGSPFCTPMKSNFSIAGFFVRAGNYLHAIGVYVNPIHPTPDGEEVISLPEGR